MAVASVISCSSSSWGPFQAGLGVLLGPVGVCLFRGVRRRPHRRAVPGGDLAHRVVDGGALLARADHQDRAGAVAGPDEGMAGPGRTVEEVPGAKAQLLVLDDRDALAREHQEVLLDALRVVLRVRLPGRQHLDVDAVVRKAVARRLERHVGPRPLDRDGAGLRDVDDEPLPHPPTLSRQDPTGAMPNGSVTPRAGRHTLVPCRGPPRQGSRMLAEGRDRGGMQLENRTMTTTPETGRS